LIGTLRAVRRADVSSLRAAVWTTRAARRTHRELRAGAFATIDLPSVPNLGNAASRGMYAVLRRDRYTCLERAIVRQAWEAAHGHERELIIGISAPGCGFGAHAWLAGDPLSASDGYVELARRPAPQL